jgi:hypothetical protein
MQPESIKGEEIIVLCKQFLNPIYPNTLKSGEETLMSVKMKAASPSPLMTLRLTPSPLRCLFLKLWMQPCTRLLISALSR